ncbi:MAG TPA: Uma2 family endonuclease [Blastocatellia bacterium]|nr:Uma2 family endonuclease [Blastocatellia bacterium]
MSTATTSYIDVIDQLPPDSSLVLHHITWDKYEALLAAVGEAKHLRISYDDGNLQIMTLSSLHENYQSIIDHLLVLVTLRRRIKILCFGSATIKAEEKGKGAEPDLCYYVQTAAVIGKKKQLDFGSDPPPDIVVEVDLHHDSFSKFPIFAKFGIPEIWRYDGNSLTMYELEQGRYVEISASRSLPLLTTALLTEFLERSKREDQYDTLLAFEEWLSVQP